MSFQIFIFKSFHNKTITLEVNSNTTVKELYNQISTKIGIPSKFIYLIYSAKVISDLNKSIDFYNIEKESTLHLHFRNYNSKFL